ncbi:MAG: hypothetical protein BWY09_00080 [Candidatus Hydrogenedentes bacterium ADurb.Bin179]|nr:MAG: hypothetical protein BWY09_00080 [Candidatus Hydrogenedentes bacterium ADurb.Bin179]
MYRKTTPVGFLSGKGTGSALNAVRSSPMQVLGFPCPPVILPAIFVIALSAFSAPVSAEGNPGESFIVMTFNTGTGASPCGDAEDNLGYGREQAHLSDKYYGNGLAWKPAVVAVGDFVREISPDIVAFQEMFSCEDCAAIPEEARAGFVCEDWRPGSPSVAQLVLGEDYQIAAHPGNADKCLAVHKRFGRIRGCESRFALGGLEGHRIEDCGGGARVARAVVERNDGGLITVISCHGTSGFSGHDRECRKQQVDQIFVDFGDGAPAVNGGANLILGDLNTDPKRLPSIDRSARRWREFVGGDNLFQFITDRGMCAPGAYLGLFHIDHIVSDAFQGEVLYPGKNPEIAPAFSFQMFDHKPIIARMTPHPPKK